MVIRPNPGVNPSAKERRFLVPRSGFFSKLAAAALNLCVVAASFQGGMGKEGDNHPLRNWRPEFASELPNDSRTHSRIAVVNNRWAVVTGRRRIIRGVRIVCRSDHPTPPSPARRTGVRKAVSMACR